MATTATATSVGAGSTDLWAAVPEPWRSSRFLLADRVRWELVAVRATVGAVLLTVRRETGPSMIGFGEPVAVAALLDEAAGSSTTPPGWLTVPRGVAIGGSTLARLELTPVSEWDWMATVQPPPPQTLEDQVEVLDLVADADEIRACLRAANPRSGADPAEDGAAQWWGLRGEGRLVGVMGASWRGGGVGQDGVGRSWHLHGLGVLAEQRGRGVGAALAAAATRAGLDSGGRHQSDEPVPRPGATDGAPGHARDRAPQTDWVSLALFADNHGARRIYQRLGYRLEHENASYQPIAP